MQALVVIQKTVRMELARRKYKPRYEMLMKINQLSAQLQKLGAMGKNLKTEKVRTVAGYNSVILYNGVSRIAVKRRRLLTRLREISRSSR